MGILKDLLLVVATLICINYFLKGAAKGILSYIVIISISALFGFSRGIAGEGIVIPICLILCEKDRLVKNGWLVLYILLVSVFTVVKGQAIFGEYDEVLLSGFTILSFRKYLFPNGYKAIAALWLYAHCKIINLVILTGPKAFTITDVNDINTRVLETTTIYGESGIIDPNYFACIAGLGFIITLMMIKFRKEFCSAVSKKWFNKKTLLYIFLCFDFFFTFRGLSRGILLAVVGSYIVFLYYSRVKFTYILRLSVVCGFIIAFCDNLPFVNGFIDRFESDETAGGRYLIWATIFDIIRNDGLLSLIIGEGLNFHWWAFDLDVAMGEILSAHNSLINIFIATGLVGVSIIIYICAKAYYNYNKVLNSVSICKAVLLTYVLVSCLSIEPLHFIWAWIVLALGCSGTLVPHNTFRPLNK